MVSVTHAFNANFEVIRARRQAVGGVYGYRGHSGGLGSCHAALYEHDASKHIHLFEVLVVT